MELADLLPSDEEVAEWKEGVSRVCPAAKGLNGERPTDMVAACPLDPDHANLHVLLQTVTLSSIMRSGQGEELPDSGTEPMTKEGLLLPLLSPEFSLQQDEMGLPSWCRSSKSHFGELVQDAYKTFSGEAGHFILPLLTPTFSAPNQTLDIEAAPEIEVDLKVFSDIRMENIVSQAALRESMKEHIEKIMKRLSEKGQMLSVLHVHINMKQEKAQDLVDYLRFQLEWCAAEIRSALDGNAETGTSAVHILALVVHGIRGCDWDRSIRPFLLAGPFIEETAASPAKMLEWTGVAVDHFSHLLPWGMRPEELLHGTIKQIFGLEEQTPERFRYILADALPHVVPRFGSEPHHADSFTIVQSLMQEIFNKPELVSCIRAVLAEQLSLEQALSMAILLYFVWYVKICCLRDSTSHRMLITKASREAG